MSEVKIRVGKTAAKSSSGSDKKGFEPVEIGGFCVKKPLTTKNSGFSKWGFCYKGDTEYFIKQFLTPVYPDDDKVDISPEIKNKKCRECSKWYENKKKIYTAICEAARNSGNIIAPNNFFKDKSHFYIVTEKVPSSGLAFEDVPKLDPEKRHILLKVIAASFVSLASADIVHADMKPENILFKRTINNFYTAKVIDFDASYLSSEPPFGDDVQGTPEYFAPESFLVLAEEKAKLTPKVDVYAMGIIFHEMLCGEKPQIDPGMTYVYEASLNDKNIALSKMISPAYRMIISKMLAKEPDKRWSAAKVFNQLALMSKNDMEPR